MKVTYDTSGLEYIKILNLWEKIKVGFNSILSQAILRHNSLKNDTGRGEELVPLHLRIKASLPDDFDKVLDFKKTGIYASNFLDSLVTRISKKYGSSDCHSLYYNRKKPDAPGKLIAKYFDTLHTYEAAYRKIKIA